MELPVPAMSGEYTTSSVSSPCVGICCLDVHGVCIGCFRTGTELAMWVTATDSQKREILARCRERRELSAGG